METVHLFISGKVHGVGFRNFVKYKAKKLGVFGWVTNIADGRVEAVLQGSKEVIDEMVKACKKGSYVSEVENVEVFKENSKEIFEGFEVRK